MNVAGSSGVNPDQTVVSMNYENGWVDGDRRLPYFSTVGDHPSVNWSEELERLHEETSRTHFLDRWTRQALLDSVGAQPEGATIMDLGCSTGYLLEDLQRIHPSATLFGVDLVAVGLLKAHSAVPAARLLQSDVCALPIGDSSVDAIVSANLLEHVPDDVGALREIARVIRPGGTIGLIVPAGPSTYDYYDRFLDHERRYARGELARKCREVGLDVVSDRFIAGLIYPAFWFVKQRNRRLHDHLRGAELERQVAADIARTKDSRVGTMLWHLEEGLAKRGVTLPFGVRSFVVARG